MNLPFGTYRPAPADFLPWRFNRRFLQCELALCSLRSPQRDAIPALELVTVQASRLAHSFNLHMLMLYAAIPPQRSQP